jgi:uroporphyrinogen decarboxylase
MVKLSSKERFSRMYDHIEADRVPIIDKPWVSTIERWNKEGMPMTVDYVDFFGLDYLTNIRIDNSPRYAEEILQEDDEYIIKTTKWGATLKCLKNEEFSPPQFLEHKIHDRKSWDEAKKLITDSDDRIDWGRLKKDYNLWQEKGYWIQAGLFFGFDVTFSWIVGAERFLMALIEDPNWCKDIFEHELDTQLKLFDKIWDKGYKFDGVIWPDDMGYKNHQFFSINTYRDLLKPFHKRAIDWAHEKGITATLHSCGNINPFIDDFIEMGLDGLNPLEVKAGMNPVSLKKKYGSKLLFQGGINAALYDKPNELIKEMEQIVPIMMKDGGYIFSSDHSIPSSVSLNDFKKIVEYSKKIGSY